MAVRKVGHVDVFLDAAGFVEAIQLSGRALYLTSDPALLQKQFRGEELKPAPPLSGLYAHVSTDAIIKANPDCYYYDDRLGTLVLRSLGNGGFVEPGDIRNGGFGILFAGDGWGEGSSREVAALALLYAGIGIVFAPSMAPIHRQNLINNGMFPVTDLQLAGRLATRERIGVEELIRGFDELSQKVVRYGGLFRFMEARAQGRESDRPIETPHRPMTIAEKILAGHMQTRHGAVKPGDAGFIQVDAGFSHDYTTAPADAMIRSALGRPPRIKNPASIHTFPDHLTLAGNLPGITSEALAGIKDLREGQRRIAETLGIQFHATASGGSTGICHTVIREEIALPGKVILGTDSHTCSAGALNCLAYGIGNTELACIWEHNEAAGRVPATVRIRLSGRLPASCTAKDVILSLAHEGKLKGTFTGKVMEFGGSGLAGIPFEEQAVLSNMAVECNALTAVMEPSEPMIQYLIERRGLTREAVESMLVYPDPDSEVDEKIELDLGAVETLVALPGHPGNGLPLERVRGTPVDMAYAGSCTAGDMTSIAMYAQVLKGRHVRIPTFIQYGSERVREEAKRRGVHQSLLAAGVRMIEEPGCGACINAGPGGPQKGQTAISATNRNMPGRMGEGDAFLANPYVVAASAVNGYICGPEDLPKE
ncbi:MAG TPA: aconitase family protein [Terriglobia bacterium]|jgi:3-isopropylmalate/(R)-2-methylmalate dehydratase large subunit